jgi:hypothetical protein
MKFRVVHEAGVLTDLDPSGTGVQVDAAINIDATVQGDKVRLSQSDAILNGCKTIAMHEQPVDQGA